MDSLIVNRYSTEIAHLSIFDVIAFLPQRLDDLQTFQFTAELEAIFSAVNVIWRCAEDVHLGINKDVGRNVACSRTKKVLLSDYTEKSSFKK